MCAAVRRTASAKPVAMPMVAVVSAWGHVSLLTLSAIPRPSSATAPLQLASALSAARITVAAACARAPALVLRMFALLGCASASRTASAKPVAMPMVAVVSAWGYVSLLTLSAIPRPSSATAPFNLRRRHLRRGQRLRRPVPGHLLWSSGCLTAGVCVCQPDCVGKACGDADGCGGQCVGTCVFANAVCNPATFQCDCTPSTCVGAICGADNGCGGLCQGTCSGPQDVCTAGVCVCQPDCVGKACGADGCGGSCGTCAFSEVCMSNGTCCTPNCAGAACGDANTCGGQCVGTCPGNDICNPTTYLCEPLELTRMVPGQFTVIYETWDAVGTSLGAVDLSTCDQTCRAQPRICPSAAAS